MNVRTFLIIVLGFLVVTALAVAVGCLFAPAQGGVEVVEEDDAGGVEAEELGQAALAPGVVVHLGRDGSPGSPCKY